MPISVITNFSINDSVPFDTRLVATSSEALNNMLYKYRGLTTYRTDVGLNYTYDGSTWAVSSNGIYGGSGDLSSDTTVNFGTVSASPLTSDSNRLTFQSYSGGDSNPNSVRVENYFIRHSSNFLGISYKNQLILSENNDQALYNGPYIMYNPKPLFNGGIGGISFGVLAGTLDPEETPSYERMRIDGSGIIRFKPNSTVDENTKSVNIGIDSTNTRPFIGFNWNGSGVDTGTDASYVQFNDSVVSIHNFSSLTGTHSAIFSKGLVRVNGSLEVTGGTISTNRNISFGAADGGVYFVSSNGNGIKFDSRSNNSYAALTYRPTPSSPISDILTWNSTQVSVTRPIVATGSATITAYNTITSYFKSQMWDNVFNPDYGFGLPTKSNPLQATADDFSDLVFKRTSDLGENVKNESGNGNTADAGNIFVKQLGFSTGSPVDTVKTTGEFVIMIGSGYASSTSNETDVSKNTFSVDARDYDRIYYFYLDGMRLQIPHQVRWWLGEPGTTTNWIQIGNIETGNKFNNNRAATSYGSTVDYASRYYSQTVLVPAGMAFKIQFRFHLTWNLTTASSDVNSPRVFVNVIRSGKFRRLGYVAPTTATTYTGGLGYPGSASDPNPPAGGG